MSDRKKETKLLIEDLSEESSLSDNPRSDIEENETPDNRKIRINVAALLGLIILAIAIFCIARLIRWNSTSITLKNDADSEAFAMECLDFYVNTPASYDDGIEDILILGNTYASNYGKDVSIVNYLRDHLDANIYDLSADRGLLSCKANVVTSTEDAFSLYYMLNDLSAKNSSHIANATWSDCYFTEGRLEKCVEEFEKVDLNKIDTILIMYNLVDYYAGRPTIILDEENIQGYHGALLSSAQYIYENYPNIRIVFVSPYPSFLYDDDGNIILSNITDYGFGNSSVYMEHAIVIATQMFYSYIDNYYFKINEKNITEYVDGLDLTDKGVELLGAHIVDFLVNKNESK